MSLIQCAKNCRYQKEGYCYLDTPTCVNNISAGRGCVHFIEKGEKKHPGLADTSASPGL